MITKRGWSPSVRDWRAKSRGKKHAKRGLRSMWEAVRDQMIGPEPDLNPETNPIVHRLAEQSQPHAQLAGWTADLNTTEKSLTRYSNRWTLRICFTFLLTVEFAGISELLAGQGMENPQRLIVAAAGACVLFYLFYKAGKEMK